jgi:hypothetical protein
MKQFIKQNPLALLINLVIENTKRLIPDHWDTLLGERTSGSRWGFHMSEDILRAIPWRLTINGLTDDEHHRLGGSNWAGLSSYVSPLEPLGFSPDCMYLSCMVEDMPKVSIKGIGKDSPRKHMTEEVRTLPEIRAQAYRYERQARNNGAYCSDNGNWQGYVTIIKGDHGYELQSHEVEPAKPASISMIIGKQENEMVIFTTHPGEVLVPLPKSFTETGDITELEKEIEMLGNMPNYAVKSFSKEPLSTEEWEAVRKRQA